MAKRGPKGKLTPERWKIIIDEISAHGIESSAAAMAGIDHSTLIDWKNKGAKSRSGKYRNFLESIKAAHQKCLRRCAMAIVRDESWQSKAWYLERRHAREFGRKDKLEISGDPAKPLKIVILKNVDAEDV